jgi:hypothetical protein
VAYPLREVLFLVVCGTIASGDDYDDIVDWGEGHLSFLRGFAEFHHGIPCVDWLRTVMNRIDPELFNACFSSWVAECWPDKPALVAIDGKTSRRSHDRKTGQKALHLCRPSPPAAGSCWARKRSRKNQPFLGEHAPRSLADLVHRRVCALPAPLCGPAAPCWTVLRVKDHVRRRGAAGNRGCWLGFFSPEIGEDAPVQTSLELKDLLRVLHAERGRKIDGARKGGAVDGHGPVAEVQIVVFGLDRPVVADRPFNAGAHRPADPVLAVGAGKEREAPAPQLSV